MNYEFVFYPEPSTASMVVSPDSGGSYTSGPYTYADGRQGQVCHLPSGIPSEQGASVQLTAPEHEAVILRGFLMFYEDKGIARIEVDDFKMKYVGSPDTPGTTPPSGPPSPLDIINRVYNETHPALWTHEGCGKFTEDCCEALHNESSEAWGHISKDPGQNQYNGHAVDAVMLVLNIPGTQNGIYDIIYSSVSSEAKPVFNYVEPAIPDKWVYPAEPSSARMGLTFVPRPYLGKK